MDVYLETGKKKTFACAVDWPGWARADRDEAGALQSLLDYGPRYARVLAGLALGFRAPDGVSSFVVIERLPGNATTDFGAPGAIPEVDARPVDEDELARLRALLAACWRAFDVATADAAGKELRRGPRGGGRDLDKMVEHVLGAEGGYLSSLGWKLEKAGAGNPADRLRQTRQAILDALDAAAHGELPTHGPRGRAYWPPRYFVRRVAWHALDHAWEIEDRILCD